MAPLAGVRFDAIAWKWKLVRLLRTAPQTAMPTAPPRLRIILNSPLAYLSRSGGRLPRPRLTLGATANTWGKPQDLRQEELRRAPVMGDEAEAPHRETKGRKPSHHEPARVEFARQHDIDRHAGERRQSGRENGHAGLPSAEPAHIAEKQRREVDGRENADAR